MMNPPRAFNLDDIEERARLLRETAGYAKESRNHGTDRSGRAFALEALEKAIAEGWRLAPPAPPDDRLPLSWWYGAGSGPETYSPAASREEALELGAEAAELEGVETFEIAQARPEPIRFDCFSADAVVDSLDDHNEEAWGEDGPPSGTVKPAAARELENMLAEAWHAWARRRSLYLRGFYLRDILAESHKVEAPAPEGGS